MGVQDRNRPAGCHPPCVANIKGVGASNELSNEDRESAADASRHRRGFSRILLCGATGVGVFQFRRLWPALALALNNDRREAETFSALFQFHLCCSPLRQTGRAPRGHQKKLSRREPIPPFTFFTLEWGGGFTFYRPLSLGCAT